MSSFKDNNNRRKIIMNHYSSPINKSNDIIETIDVYSDVCVDELHMKIILENGIVKDAKFFGEGCAVFLSSSDIFLEKIKNKNISQVKSINKNYKNMISQDGKYHDSILGELLVFENVSSHLNRLHCAEIISLAVDKFIDEHQ